MLFKDLDYNVTIEIDISPQIVVVHRSVSGL